VIDTDLVSTTAQKTGAFKWTVLENDPWKRLLSNTIYEDLSKNEMLKDCNWKDLGKSFPSLSDFLQAGSYSLVRQCKK